MPKNKGKGGKNRRRGKNINEGEKRDLIIREEGQEYGQVLKILGNGYVESFCFDGENRLCHIRGKMRKKIWVNNGDIVLVCKREFQNGRGDIVHKYTPYEAKKLKTIKEIPDGIKLVDGNFVNANNGDGMEQDDDVNFDYNAEHDSDEEFDGDYDYDYDEVPKLRQQPQDMFADLPNYSDDSEESESEE